MKKLMFIAACAASMVAVADVTSANIVGYNTVTIQPGFNMLSVNFKDVSNTEGIGIQDLFLGGGNTACPFKGATGSADADQIQIYVNDGVNPDYVNYYLYYNSKKSTDSKNYFWCDKNNAVENNKRFKNGDTLWFNRKGDTAVTFNISGEVELKSVKAITINKGFNMIGNCFPTGWAVNDAPYDATYWGSTGAKGATGSSDADQIQIYINDGENPDYVNYYLYYNSKKSTDPKNWKWCDKNNAAVEGVILEPGQGAWYNSKGDTSFTIEIKKQF